MAKQPSQLEMLYNASSKPQDIVNNPMFNNYMRTVQYPELFNHLSKGGSMVTLPNKPAPLSMSGMPPAVQNIMSQSTTSSAPPKITFPNVKKTSTSTGAGTKSTTQPKATSTGTGAKSAPVTVSASASAPKTTPKVTVTLPNGTKTTGFINPKDNRTYYDSGFTKPVTTAGAKVTVITGKNRKDFTVGGKTSGETKAETATDTNAEDTNAETAESTEVVDYNALAGEQAQKQIDQQVANINNFLTRLESSRNQTVIGAERQAEMARQGMENQMFQNWLGVRQAMTNRGMTGSGIAEDANTRLGMARQQELSNLFTNLSTEINKINEDARLTKQEKEQQILDLQNSYNDLQRQIARGMLDEQFKKQQAQAELGKTQAETAKIGQQNRLDWAKEFGADPVTGQPTQRAKEFESDMELKLKQYGLSLADVTGYLPSVDAKGNTIYIPTLSREKFIQSQKDTIIDRNRQISQFNQQMQMAGQKAQAESFNNKVKNIEGGLTNLMDYTKSVYDAAYKAYSDIPDKKSDEAVKAYDTMQGAFDQWISTGTQYAQFNKDPLSYVDNVSNKKASSTGMAPSTNKKNIGDFLTDWSQYR